MRTSGVDTAARRYIDVRREKRWCWCLSAHPMATLTVTHGGAIEVGGKPVIRYTAARGLSVPVAALALGVAGSGNGIRNGFSTRRDVDSKPDRSMRCGDNLVFGPCQVRSKAGQVVSMRYQLDSMRVELDSIVCKLRSNRCQLVSTRCRVSSRPVSVDLFGCRGIPRRVKVPSQACKVALSDVSIDSTRARHDSIVRQVTSMRC